MDLQKVFSQLGLKEEHMKVYLSNLEWGETIITNIARKSKLPRTTIYILIKDLLDLGLVTRTMKQGQPYYRAADPDFLNTLLKKKQEELSYSLEQLKNSMTNLKAIQNANPKKPKVEFLEGPEGIKQAYDRSLSDNPEQIDIQCFTGDYGTVVSEEFFNNYFEKFFASRTKSREMITDTDDDLDYIKKHSKKNKMQLMVDIEGQKIETDFWVYDNKVTFVSFNKENPYALVIEDSEIAKATKIMFDRAWREAARNDKRVLNGEKVQTKFE